MRIVVVLSVLAGSFLTMAIPAYASDAYKLDVQDKIRVYVTEWPALNVEVAVGANGSVALPIVGEVQARGLEPAQLANAVATRLKAEANQRRLPDVSVDIVVYRPFYILGAVTTPGEYSYRPDMLVLNAISIAGGLYRVTGNSEWDLERTSISGIGELNVAELRRATLLAEQIRYDAEINDRNFPPIPASATPDYAKTMNEQRELFDANLRSYENQSETLTSMIALHKTEIQSIELQLETVTEKLAAYEEEVAKAIRLEKQRLAVNLRLPLQRDLFDIQREKRQLEFEKVRSESAVHEAQLRIETLSSARKSAAQEGLQRTKSQMREIEQQFETLSKLVAGASSQSAHFDRSDVGEKLPVLRFTITRGRGAQMQQIAATEITPIVPGDIIKVELSNNKSK